MSLNERLQQRREGTPPGFQDPAPERPAEAVPAPAGSPPPRTPGPPPGAASTGLLSRTERPAASGGSGSVQGTAIALLRAMVHEQLVNELSDTEAIPEAQIRLRLAEIVDEVSRAKGMVINRTDRNRLVEVLAADVVGLGPLDDLLADETVTEIMVNSEAQIYVERDGVMGKSETHFDSRAQLMQVIDRIVARIGRRIDESSPMVDARLEDGSRVHIIIPPLALTGPTVTIRKFGKEAMPSDDLVTNGTCTADMLDFMKRCVRARLNIIVSGGGGSGKTTTLNILSSFLPEDERIVTIEDAAELQLRQPHVVPLETRPANVEGRGSVSIRDLVINSLRMRPDRIVIGECRGAEALDMLQAMNTGHDGSLTTVHANSPEQVPARLETLVLMAGTDLPSRAIREQVSSAIQLIIHQNRLRDGTRKITGVSEVVGMVGEDVVVKDIFVYHQLGITEAGGVVGYHTATGYVPRICELLEVSGMAVDPALFIPTPEPPNLAGMVAA
jgi:pilus assembly protein CpaF